MQWEREAETMDDVVEDEGAERVYVLGRALVVVEGECFVDIHFSFIFVDLI